ncbi:MAG: hypothetical protein COY40_00040 [Alphaproteobacteria bacterium CG_4_10_14_0_8_um_filter_53_9]|nr:MAG: hypothetical protein COY40_00040 [Alphaproteobacteria bacterium CG_4_10_14_0_8_um_filter_53_9]
MVLRRTLPSRVSAEADTKTAEPTAPVAGATPSVEAGSITPEPVAEKNVPDAAEVSAQLDDALGDFPAPKEQTAPASLEESFEAPPTPAAPEMPPQMPEAASAPVAEPEKAQQEETPSVAAAPESAPQEVPAAPSEPLVPSKPHENKMKPRVREKKPRNFGFTPPAEPAPVEESAQTSEAAPAMEAPADMPPAYGQKEAETRDTEGTSSYSAGQPLEEEAPFAGAPAPAVADWKDIEEEEKPQSAPEEFNPFEEALAEEDPAAAPAPAPLPSSSSVRDEEVQAEEPAAMPVEEKKEEDEEAPAPSSDLPWVQAAEQEGRATLPDADDWAFAADQTEEVKEGGMETSAPSMEAPVDIYGPASASRSPMGAETTEVGMPASLPELPGAAVSSARAAASAKNKGSLQWFMGAAVVLAVGFGVFQLVRNDDSQERVARLTGALTETTEKLPPEMGGVQPNDAGNLVTPESVFSMDGSNGGILPPPVTGVESQPMPTGNTVIDFADVSPAEQNQPIVADGSEQMPEDIGLIAKFQQAVAVEKAKQGTAPDGSVAATAVSDQTGLSPKDKALQNMALQQKIEAELDAYRQTLATADNALETPKPSEFLRGGEEPLATKPAPVEPPAATGAEMAGENPSNLPILPEPTAETTPPVRTLADFDVAAFEPDKNRVRIPKGIKPRFSSTDFPEMEVLSFVPGRGVIAFNRGREGVLLIGESLEGWELITVGPDSAQFSNGKRTQYVTAE